MVNVAASGGYYIASASDSIVATGQTITGSIGVVGGKLVLGKVFEKHDVQAHTIATTEDSDFFDWWTPFNPSQRERFKGSYNVHMIGSSVVSKVGRCLRLNRGSPRKSLDGQTGGKVG